MIFLYMKTFLEKSKQKRYFDADKNKAYSSAT